MQTVPLSLTPPAEVSAVTEEDIQQNLPGPVLTSAAKQNLTARAKERTGTMVAVDPMSPDFQQVINDIEAIGNKTIRSTTDISNRLLSSPRNRPREQRRQRHPCGHHPG